MKLLSLRRVTKNRDAAQSEELLKLRAEYQALFDNRLEIDSILDNMIEGVIVVDQSGRISLINNSAAKLLDLSTKNAKGRIFAELLRVSQIDEALQSCLNAELTERTGLEFNPIKDQAKTVEVYVKRLDNPPNIRALVVLKDTTRVRKLETMRRDFVANVSHELKTPLTSIKGFVETIQDGAINEPEEAKRFLAIISRQVDRLNLLVEDLLKLAQLEQPKEIERVDLSSTNLAQAIDGVLESLSQLAKSKQICIEVNCSDSLDVLADPSLLEQAIQNLVDNAIKYSPEGTVVKLQATQHNAKVYLNIIDQGPGIEPKHIERIFERFYRVDKARSRSHGGTGLGLAIAKHIAQALAGNISVSSELGRGSTFTLELKSSS